MSPPNPPDDYSFSFENGQQKPVPPKKKKQDEEGDSLLDDVSYEVVDAITDNISGRGCGCLIRLITLPFRLVMRLFDMLSD
jgi:hypothetical protein